MLLNNNTQPVVNKVKDLGVVVNNHLTFHSHIDKIVARAFHSLERSLILKCFVSRDLAIPMRVFLVNVRPIL